MVLLLEYAALYIESSIFAAAFFVQKQNSFVAQPTMPSKAEQGSKLSHVIVALLAMLTACPKTRLLLQAVWEKRDSWMNF